MPETLNGDESQVNLANTATVDIAAAGGQTALFCHFSVWCIGSRHCGRKLF
jgi:hypothetical protein